MKLRSFRESLERRLGGDRTSRPFVCDGDPYGCTAFIVGISPASSVGFWEFWSDETGFARSAWLDHYVAERAATPLKPGRIRRPSVSNTRQRIERIVSVAAPLKVLETNLFSVATAAAHELTQGDMRTDVFEYLLSELSLRIILLYGKPARTYFSRRYNSPLSDTFSICDINEKPVYVADIGHLFNASRARAIELGEAMQKVAR